MKFLSFICKVFNHSWKNDHKFLPTYRKCWMCGKKMRWKKANWE